jgi:uncharacterized protein (DUF305 family)
VKYPKTVQINIDKKTGTFLGVIVVLVLAVVFLLAGNTSMPMNHDGHGSMSSDEDASGTYTDDELMFAQMMIPHHSQAVTMSELALANSTNPQIISLATAIRDAQAPEIAQMQSWLDQSDYSGTHAGHMDMGGMLSDEELAELSTAKGSAFDRLFLEGMIAHHESAIDMLSMIKNSTNSEVKKLSADIFTSQSAEFEAMKALLK